MRRFNAMEFKLLRTFLAVAERQNFTSAAKSLHIAQPAVSQQIRQLENDLGTPLFFRENKKVSLTAAGEHLVPAAKDLLLRAKTIQEQITLAGEGEIGEFTIGSFSSATSGFLPEWIQLFRKKYPNVRIHLCELSPEEQIKALENREIDLGFNRPIDPGLKQLYHSILVFRDQLMVALPIDHPHAEKKKVQLKSLKQENWVFFRRTEAVGMVDTMMSLCNDAGFSPIVVSEPRMMQTLLMEVAAGVGVSLVPGCVASFQQPGVLLLPLSPASPAIDLELIYPKNCQNPAALNFVELMKEIAAKSNR
ncbi:MAG: LysR family transcriptional regulator [Verrucomicrobiota bacterium]